MRLSPFIVTSQLPYRHHRSPLQQLWIDFFVSSRKSPFLIRFRTHMHWPHCSQGQLATSTLSKDSVLNCFLIRISLAKPSGQVLGSSSVRQKRVGQILCTNEHLYEHQGFFRSRPGRPVRKERTLLGQMPDQGMLGQSRYG